MQLREPVDGHVQQLGSRVLEAVPARVVGGVAQAEVGTLVDDRRAGGEQVRRQVRGRAVGQGQEDRIDRRQLAVDGQLGRAEVRVDAGDGVVVALATLEADEVDVRVPREEADELRADVAGRPDDADPDPTRAAGGIDVRVASGGRTLTGGPSRLDDRLEPGAHGRHQPLTGGWLGWVAETGWTVVMVG